MDPNDINDTQNTRQPGALATGQRGFGTTPPARNASQRQQQAAANIIRGQLEHIYSGGSGENTPHTTPAPAPSQETTPAPAPAAVSAPTIQRFADDTTVASVDSTVQQKHDAKAVQGHGFRTSPPEQQKENTPSDDSSAYRRTMVDETPRLHQEEAQWQQYHSAWQKYYQLYYERHYLNSLQTQRKSPIELELAKDDESTNAMVTASDTSISQNEAMSELRDSIRQKISASAEKVKKSRHLTPIIAGLAVLLIFTFLQYNRVLFGALAAYASPGSIEPHNIIASPTTNTDVDPEPRMIIPKINIDAPVVYGIGPDYKSQMTAMEKGIAHFSIPGANATPGQVGNTVLAAHSSNDVFAAGDYKQIFAQNEKLKEGDVIYMNYESKRYTYAVTRTEVVMPDEVSKVQLNTDKPMLTLISCVPLGTAQKRLLVFAEQISPDPTKAESTSDSSTAPSSTTIPGRPSPTLLERLFGAD